MAMTRLEKGTKFAIWKFLRQQGYVTYADIFSKYELNFHKPAGRPFAAMVDPETGTIYIHPNLKDKSTLSVLIRHEILHLYLAHQKRYLKHLAKQMGLSWQDIDDLPLSKMMELSDEELAAMAEDIRDGVTTDREIARKMMSQTYKGYPTGNYLMDLEISNRGYTDLDKSLVRNMTFYVGDKEVQGGGLVTDDLEPDFIDMSLEEMMDAVEKRIKEEKEAIEQDAAAGIIRGKFDPKTGRFKGRDGVLYGKA